MPECFVAKASELNDGDRRIVIAGRGDRRVLQGRRLLRLQQLLRPFRRSGLRGLMINRVIDVIAPDRTYQGQTFSDEVHFVCPWHGYEYELKTGECVGDRRLKLKEYDVVRRGDDIFVVA